MGSTLHPALAGAVLAAAFAAAAGAAPPALVPCGDPMLPRDARCTTVEVFENRAAAAGRKISLKVVVLPGRAARPAADPIFFFAGEPGDSTTALAGYFHQFFSDLRGARDVVLVDARGTGGSNPLPCSFQGERSYLQDLLDDFIPTDGAAACREALGAKADLRFYGTRDAADDAEEVRNALGYGKVNLMGGSYGTRLVLTYLKRHPEAVRSVVMMGLAPSGEPSPLRQTLAGQRALNGVLRLCRRDGACARAFPKLRRDLRRVGSRLRREPVTVKTDGGDVSLSRDGFAQVLYAMLRNSATAASVPLAIHGAARGDFAPLREPLNVLARSRTSAGAYLAVTCGEDVAYGRLAAWKARRTFLGDFLLHRHRAACAGWPRGAPADARSPSSGRRVSVPALLISGELDPVTPPRSGRRVASELPGSRHLVVGGAGHDVAGVETDACVWQLLARFLDQGTADGLDVSCSVNRPPFVLRRRVQHD